MMMNTAAAACWVVFFNFLERIQCGVRFSRCWMCWQAVLAAQQQQLHVGSLSWHVALLLVLPSPSASVGRGAYGVDAMA
jgi:hypothetical protein